MSYSVRGRFAIVTGGGGSGEFWSRHWKLKRVAYYSQGINHAITRLLLNAGCSVMFADLALRPESEAIVQEYSHPATNKPLAVFCKTDMSDWTQISAFWSKALETFGHIDIVVNGAGIYELPPSSFWNPPGISPLSEDPEDAQVGQYKSFAVNTIGPIRLAQIAVDYWQQHPDVQGNILFLASIGGYMHSIQTLLYFSIQTLLYFSSKAAIVSFFKCLGPLRAAIGVRNAAVCPGPVFVCVVSNI